MEAMRADWLPLTGAGLLEAARDGFLISEVPVQKSKKLCVLGGHFNSGRGIVLGLSGAVLVGTFLCLARLRPEFSK